MRDDHAGRDHNEEVRDVQQRARPRQRAERCGAVVAACDIVTKKATFPGSIGPMVKAIVPAARAVKGQPGDFVDNAVRESARRTAIQIATKSKIVAASIKAGKVKVVAARYDLDEGKVEYLS